MVFINNHVQEVYCIFDGWRGIDTQIVTQDKGLRTYRHTDENSCPEGTDIWFPRTAAFLDAVFAKYGRVAGYVGIYGKANGCGGCTSHAMNSQTEQAAHWTSVGPSTGAPTEPWFMRSVAYSEPNGALARHALGLCPSA